MLDVSTAAEALREWCQRRGVERGTEEFISYLADKKALYLLPSVLRRLRSIADKKRGEQILQINAADELKSDDLAKLNKATESSPVESSVDSSLLAGLRVSHQNRRVNGTIKDQLENLHTSLTT